MPLPALPLLAAPLVGSWDDLGLWVGAVVLVAALVVVAVTARRGRGATGSGGSEPGGPEPGGPEPGVTRRVLLERGVLGLFVAALAGVVAASIDYVVSAVESRRGRTFALGSVESVRRQLKATGRPYYHPVGGFYVMAYPAADLSRARARYPAPVVQGMAAGFVALDQACTHLGCRVPWCPSSEWFECPCHGSRYSAVGEQRRGPAPRGLDHYHLTVVDGQVTVNTAVKYPGPPPGTDTTGQEAAGPHCF